MANLTLAEARTKVGQLLDDASNVRYSSANVDDALADALNVCLTRYASEGGDRFDLETTGTTSASTGASSALTGAAALLIKQVSVVSGSVAYRIPAKNPMRRGYPDLTARDIRILYVREYALPTTTTHPLVGVGATEANSWRAFDRWVCYEAAVQLAIKDQEQARLAVLRSEADRASTAALIRPSTPGGYPVPRPEWSPAYEDLSWQAVGTTIYLNRSGWLR